MLSANDQDDKDEMDKESRLQLGKAKAALAKNTIQLVNEKGAKVFKNKDLRVKIRTNSCAK